MNEFWLTGIDTPTLRQPPLAELADFETPLEKVFCVRHMDSPEIDRSTWRLAVGGMVERELILSLADIQAMAQIEIRAFHECAGNPAHPNIPVRRVANVTWGGVRLSDVLARAGIAATASFVWSYGADSGDYEGIDLPSYVKDLPLVEVRRDEVLLATHINGEPLDDKHGGPVRLVVPGFYGTNSTKWLVRLELHAVRCPGYFTTVIYNDRIVKDGEELVVPVWRVAPHSVLVQPIGNTKLPWGLQKIRGWAWGADPIAQVEVSTDDGVSWRTAQLSEREGHAWQCFELDWTPPSPGLFQLHCRAVDCAGIGQPERGARNAIFSISVTVE